MDRRRTIVAAAAAAVLLAGLAACSASSGSSSSSGSSASGAAPRSAAGSGGSESSSTTGTSTQQAATAQRVHIYHGEVSVSARDVAAVADRAVQVVERIDGEIDSDDRTSGSYPTADLTFRVLPKEFRPTMDRLAGLSGAQEQSRSSSATDVTTKVADIDSQVSSQRTTVTQIRAFMRQTHDLDQLIKLQEQLGTQEAELESLQAEQRGLRNDVGLSTIQLRIRHEQVPTKAPVDRTGFLAGLSAGWHGFAATVRVVLTAFGALLPFLVVLVLLAAPVYVVLRRRRRTTAAAAK